MNCCICSESLENGSPTVVLRERGSESINEASRPLDVNIVTHPGQVVHQVCRKNHCHHKDIIRHTKSTILEDKSSHLRSQSNLLAYKDHCLFCAKLIEKVGKNHRGLDSFSVRTFDFKRTIEHICDERKDEWADEVRDRLTFCSDLPAVDAIYHQKCNVNFITGKQVPLVFQEPSPKMKQVSFKGRPENSAHSEAFRKALTFLEENDDEQITIMDLVNKMRDFCPETEPYSSIYMKKRIKEHFGTSIIITKINGVPNVVTIKSTASSILHEFYSRPNVKSTRQKELAILETAAKLLRNEIKDMNTNKMDYPSPTELESTESKIDILPESMQVFLSTLFNTKKSDIKLASLGQAIVQTVRPRVLLAPLQIGLAVQLHNHFSSKFLIDVLYNLGFCSSYTEVSKYEASQFHLIPICLKYSPGIWCSFQLTM